MDFRENVASPAAISPTVVLPTMIRLEWQFAYCRFTYLVGETAIMTVGMTMTMSFHLQGILTTVVSPTMFRLLTRFA